MTNGALIVECYDPPFPALLKGGFEDSRLSFKVPSSSRMFFSLVSSLPRDPHHHALLVQETYA